MLFRSEGYVARQVTGWTNRAAQARTDEVPAMDHVARWLAEHLPPESGAALIHNDYKYDNLLLEPRDLTEIDGKLDVEGLIEAILAADLRDLGGTGILAGEGCRWVGWHHPDQEEGENQEPEERWDHQQQAA